KSFNLISLASNTDCPIPQHGENTVLTEESLLKNSFPDGTVITYKCRNGYYKVSGTGTMNCVDGKWTEPDIILKECGLPEAQPHMLFDTSEGTLFGAMVKITCEEGYRVTGWNYRLCMDIGWYGKGDCVLVTCPIPTKVENGEHSWSSDDKPEYQQTIHFSCNTGYTMVGNKTIRCTKTGKYDFGPPQCIGKFLCFISGFTEDLLAKTIYTFCPIPKGGENMNLTDESLLKKDFPAGTEVTYECIIGYEKVSGTGIMKCDDGKWTKPDIICRSESCLTCILHLTNTVIQHALHGHLGSIAVNLTQVLRWNISNFETESANVFVLPALTQHKLATAMLSRKQEIRYNFIKITTYRSASNSDVFILTIILTNKDL
uniref:Sushi domain-containing protein n=1 Tax=Xiphophorus couchianus TaxID=32473 RepID=A0A3B5MC31_9TELE